ncbi:OLC1v1035738C1 [Oldenlandia corymbosa var. corymbosa]|uniref:OLC1v1035738C1 n=1 Tax=Oldenlandia corymbosa var. corymbosa TaxID=529605 RepID=A0AAV1CUV6_OLDCO|nr:OLC1v1035738C1 [Oldenlandia corymbosa var. corymbosa]
MFHDLVVFVLFLPICIQGAPSSWAKEESDALLKWKASLLNQNNPLLASWHLEPPATNDSNSSHLPNRISSPCIHLYGISCINASINRLNLSNSNIDGTLNVFPFSSLPNLEYLDLSVNHLSGNIPSEIGYYNPSKLMYLDLGTNHLEGYVPSSLI